MKARQSNRDFWFPAKRYGSGWGPPVRWQGWVFMAIWFASFGIGMIYIIPMESEYWAIALVAFLAGMSTIPTAVCYWKGEPLRRRRSEEDDRDACLNCGYNLTGNISGMCPECGERIPLTDSHDR
jgi:hypothetical protein